MARDLQRTVAGQDDLAFFGSKCRSTVGRSFGVSARIIVVPPPTRASFPLCACGHSQLQTPAWHEQSRSTQHPASQCRDRSMEIDFHAVRGAAEFSAKRLANPSMITGRHACIPLSSHTRGPDVSCAGLIRPELSHRICALNCSRYVVDQMDT
ncbi:hypothetical protein IQ06DRAFT_154000 [Phaeosphaeriaceae sp. SRC1lsM3a]|nr:hypothetical protein IQ06DRAFT_154000 [Stagonospora sp. SRC1lsM3a]